MPTEITILVEKAERFTLADCPACHAATVELITAYRPSWSDAYRFYVICISCENQSLESFSEHGACSNWNADAAIALLNQ